MYVIILCGIPGSGKSTFARKYVEKHDKSCVILSMDALRKRLPDGTLDQSDNKAVYQKYVENYRECLRNGQNVILDATNALAKGRRSLLSMIQEECCDTAHLVEKIAIEFDADVKDAIKNNKNEDRDHVTPDEYIIKASVRRSSPSNKEGFDNCISVKTDYENGRYKVLRGCAKTCSALEKNIFSVIRN